MKKWPADRWLRCARVVAIASLSLCALPTAWPQGLSSFAPDQLHSPKDHLLPDSLPDRPSIAPAFTIPAEPLGFSAPGAIYMGQRFTMASLDFLDENRLLFTFRVPGLIHRQAGDSWSDEERQIRAVVLELPSGAIEAETVWPLHDRSRYLWMLKDGHYLVRDRNDLLVGGPTLELKQLLHFPGPLLSVSMDPTQQYMVTNSREPAAPKPGEVPSPKSASASVAVDGQDTNGQDANAQQDLVVRILRRDSGKVMLVSRVRSAVRLPINADGYIESLRGNGTRWMVNLDYFTGGSRILGNVESACSPEYDFVSQREVLVTACLSNGADKLTALDTDGHHLWEDQTQAESVWPLVISSPDGSRLARETLAVNHPVNAYQPLDPSDIKGQLIRVFDAATGWVALAAPASPALDAGGNVAISPSGRRVALINAGAIQVFELPAPPPLPVAPPDQKSQKGQTAH
ncbi:MAG: hypothetical protein ABR923_12135 [Terracidiphilus sp.]|jgi:hypothetical protein